jgi:hypothetical protein
MPGKKLTAIPILLVLLGFVVVACGRGRGGGGGGGEEDDDDSSASDDDDTGQTDDDDATPGGECDTEGETVCNVIDFMICNDEQWELVETCLDPTPLCHDVLGCLVCDPGSTWCENGDVWLCDEDGMGGEITLECADDEECVGGECWGACETAEAQLSYLGCHFMAVSTVNMWLPDGFADDFGVAIGNPDTVAAEVTVRRGSSVVTTQSVPAGQTVAIELPMVDGLQMAHTTSTTLTDAAYEIESSVPVAAYQYNPLHYSNGIDSSYTNDASMLLPEHVLTGNYMAGTYPPWGYEFQTDWSPSFVAIAGVVDGTQVTFTAGGVTAGGNPGALNPGDSTSFTLNRGDVAQIVSYQPSTPSTSYCASQGWPTSGGFCWATDGDLTGSEISTDGAPVAVFAGHACTYMPFDLGACDHLEEMMLPTETWGTQVVMSALVSPANSSSVVGSLFRVLALHDGTSVSFSPAVASTVGLDAGEFAEFSSEQDFMVEATSPVYVYQAVYGQVASGSTDDGDPAMGSGIPQLQVRDKYDFLVPDTYQANYVNVVAPAGTSVILDTGAVSGWQAIGSTGFEVARVPLSAGSHHIESSNGVGFSITSYGYADWTSYLYPGGMNLTRQ